MRIKFIPLCLFLSLFAVTSTQVRATTLASWNLQGQPGNQAFTAGVGSPHVTAMNVTRGPGMTATAGADSITARNWDTMNPATDYFTFGFTIDPGFAVNLDALYVRARSSFPAPKYYGLFYSGDGFATNLYTFEQPGVDLISHAIDLSGLTGLTGGVEFRIIAISDEPAGPSTDELHWSGTYRLTNYFDGDEDTGSFRFTGSVVPEPGAVSLASVALLSLGGWGRRWR